MSVLGMEVFRNTANDPQAIPMDLPVGPITSSVPVTVSRSISGAAFRSGCSASSIVKGVCRCPKAGPFLVSGRKFGRGQQAVQQMLRTQYRDISVDISLSRLRTVRVYVVGDVAEPGAYDIARSPPP